MSKTNIFYLRVNDVKSPSKGESDLKVDRRSVGCVAWTIENESVKFSLSVCSDIDDFDKTVARRIASQRLNSEKLSTVLPMLSSKKHEIIKSIMVHLASLSGAKAPRRAINSARAWLELSELLNQKQGE